MDQVTEQTSAAAVSSSPAEISSNSYAPASPTTTPSPAVSETGAAGLAQPSEPAPYAADFKFRYRDADENKIDGEIDDWARTFINQENEEKFKQIWAKAHGLDFVKNRFSKTKGEFQEYKSKVDPLLQAWDDLSTTYNRGDLDGFFKGLQIPDEVLFKHVLDKLNYQQLPPEQRAERDRMTHTQRRAHELETQNQALQQQFYSQQVQARETTLQQSMSKPEVAAVAEAFDQRLGKQGAFREEVIKRGVLAHTTTGQDITPEQAISEVMGIYAAFVQPSQAGQMSPQMTPGAPQGTSKQTPVIPNVGAKNSSPTRKSPKSLDELRQLADQMG